MGNVEPAHTIKRPITINSGADPSVLRSDTLAYRELFEANASTGHWSITFGFKDIGMASAVMSLS